MNLAQLTLQELYTLRVELNNKIEAIETKAFEDLSQGKEVAGFALKQGRKSRKWINENLLTDMLMDRGLNSNQIYDIKLKGIPAIEKLTKGSDISLDNFIEVTEGKQSLVYIGGGE